ncbi:MAG: FeoA family protein [Clostridiaceae bacterium]|jgi:ferrous iron transport protein A
MPLLLANVGEEIIIRKVVGDAKTKQHLNDLGFVAGGNVTIISEIGGNLIVSVKESRVAISREMAGFIIV